MARKKGEALTVDDIVMAIEEIAPLAIQEDWDNSGLLIGFGNKQVRRVLTCLEINSEVVTEAIEGNFDMIITHHPLIFTKIASLKDSNAKDKWIMELVAAGISVYSCHTPFDKVKGGNNDVVADLLGLTSVRDLKGNSVASQTKMAENHDDGHIGRIGKFKEPVLLSKVIEKVAEKLNLSIRQIRYTGTLDAEITNVGICTGAGADLMDMAASSGCELFITGDVKYHEAQDSLEKQINIIDAGHYGTEKFFAETMKTKLEKGLSEDVKIIASKVDLDPFSVV